MKNPYKIFTVVGFYSDTDQRVIFHTKARTHAEAETKELKRNETLVVVASFEGRHISDNLVKISYNL